MAGKKEVDHRSNDKKDDDDSAEGNPGDVVPPEAVEAGRPQESAFHIFSLSRISDEIVKSPTTCYCEERCLWSDPVQRFDGRIIWHH